MEILAFSIGAMVVLAWIFLLASIFLMIKNSHNFKLRNFLDMGAAVLLAFSSLLLGIVLASEQSYFPAAANLLAFLMISFGVYWRFA